MYGKLRECKTVEELCSVFDELSNIPTEHSLVCGTYVLPPFGIGANIPGRFLYAMSREFRNLKVHIKTHFENEFHMDNVHEREREIRGKSKRETRVHATTAKSFLFCFDRLLLHKSAGV